MVGSLGWGGCRDTFIDGAGNRGTLGTDTLVVSIGDGTGDITLGDGAGSGAVEGAGLGVFLRVSGNIGDNDSIGRRG